MGIWMRELTQFFQPILKIFLQQGCVCYDPPIINLFTSGQYTLSFQPLSHKKFTPDEYITADHLVSPFWHGRNISQNFYSYMHRDYNELMIIYMKIRQCQLDIKGSQFVKRKCYIVVMPILYSPRVKNLLFYIPASMINKAMGKPTSALRHSMFSSLIAPKIIRQVKISELIIR